MRRCPFSENIHGCVDVSLVRGATVGTRPGTISQCEVLVDAATHRAQLRRGEPAVDVMHDCASLRGNVVQRLHKRGKAQVRHFAAPQGFHPLQVQRFQGDEVIGCTQAMRQCPVKGVPLIRHALMDPGKVHQGLLTIVRALLFAGKPTVRLGKRLQTLLERLWCVKLCSVTIGQIRRQPKVKACAFTCHDSVNGLRFIQKAGEIHVQVPKRIPLDGDGFDRTLYLSGLRVFVDGRTDLETVAIKQLPSGLRQRERLGMTDFAKRWWTHTPGDLTSLPRFHIGEERLIAFINARGNLLGCLGTKLLPPGVPWQLLQLGKMAMQRVDRHMLLVQTIVASMQCDAMIMNRSTDVNLTMQPPVALTPIQFVRECLAHDYLTPSRLACSRIMTSSLAVMLMPDFSANANNRRLASMLRRRLVAFGFSILHI